jgi:hypothetical protein
MDLNIIPAFLGVPTGEWLALQSIKRASSSFT